MNAKTALIAFGVVAGAVAGFFVGTWIVNPSLFVKSFWIELSFITIAFAILAGAFAGYWEAK